MTPPDFTAFRSTPITELLGIDAPVVLGPFGGVSSVQLTAAVSDGGGLGSYGLLRLRRRCHPQDSGGPSRSNGQAVRPQPVDPHGR